MWPDIYFSFHKALPWKSRRKITRNYLRHQRDKTQFFFIFYFSFLSVSKGFCLGFSFFFPIYLILCFSTSKKLRDEFVIMGSLKESQRRDMEEDESKEPILMAQNQRFTMFPIRYKSIWEMYKKAEASFWTG